MQRSEVIEGRVRREGQSFLRAVSSGTEGER
jgi:hypothetical protein